MKYLSILAISLTVATGASYAADGYVKNAGGGVAVGVSASGSEVFGYNGRSGENSQATWLFDVATQSRTQFTEFSSTDLDVAGQVAWITSSGTKVGTLRDQDWLSPEVNDGNNGTVSNYPLNTACIWKNGTLLKLDHNRWTDPASFVAQDGTIPNIGNGFYAMHISDDESAIVGYLKAFTYMLPVRWTRNDDGSYTSTMLSRQVGEFFYTFVGASADCRRVVMNTSQSGGKSYIWDGDNTPVVFSYKESGSAITDQHLTAISPNGNYAIMSCYRDGKPAHGVYDFTTGNVKWIAIPDGAASSNWFAANVVTDRGDGYIVDYNYRLHYFNTELNINIPFQSYIDAFGSDITKIDAVPAKALVRMVSEDGRTICGNYLQNSLEENGWIVRLPESSPMLFAPTNCKAVFSSPGTLLVKWDAPQLPSGASVSRYVIEIDNECNIITNPATGADGLLRAEVPCATGEHKVLLYAFATDKDGKEWESVHQAMEVAISDNTSLFFFEDLDDSDIDTSVMAYIYTHDTFRALTPDDSRALSFRIDAGDFCNLTPFWYTCGFAPVEWHTYHESRWFDASDCKEDFYFTWQERNLPINDAIKEVASNKFRVEYTTDGENWMLLHESDGESNAGKWNVRVVDLSFLKGKTFRLRFHAVGGGQEACEWRLDYYGIKPASEIYDAPQGLMVTSETDDEVKLAWKNNRGEYEVSYNYNSPMTYNQSFGNEGMPLYVACDYGPAKMKAFEGKYITAVSTMLYEPTTVNQSYHTTVQAVIFDENGTELSRGTLSDDAPWYEDEGPAILPIHHISLNTPVKVEAGKTYRVSILITDYEPDMCPIWYFSASDDYIPGVTDLFSDDDLGSWNSASDFIREISIDDDEFNAYGRCIFNIRPCISDAPEISTLDYVQEQWFYQVFRDGKLLPHGIAYYTQQSVTDKVSGSASYTVQSYRRDGAVSEMSEPLNFSPAGIENVIADGATQDLVVVKTDNGLLITGDFDTVAVYNLTGVKVADTRHITPDMLPHGIYIVNAVKNGKHSSCKIVL